MKKDQVPQQPDANLGINLKLLKYAVNPDGTYEGVQSTGWEAENTVLSLAWDEIENRIEKIKQQVLAGQVSPLAYYLEKNQLDVKILSDYTGFWQFTIRRHLKPGVFKSLSDKKLAKYASVFQITVEQLKNLEAK